MMHLWSTYHEQPVGILLYKVQKKDTSYDSVVLSRNNVIYSGCTHSYVGPAEKYTFIITITLFNFEKINKTNRKRINSMINTLKNVIP